MTKAKEWVGLVGDADSFDVPVAYTYGHVEEYLSELSGNEDKRIVAGNVAKIVKKCAPYYLHGYPSSYADSLKSSFQALVDMLVD